MEYQGVKLCVICAWREFCKKKYLYPGGLAFNCPDFSKDMRIKEDEEEERK